MSGFRIWSTTDGRYVGDGHLDAAFLAAGPADKQPDDFDPETFQNADGTFPLSVNPVEPTEPEGDADEEAEPEKLESEAATEPEKPEPAATAKRGKK